MTALLEVQGLSKKFGTLPVLDGVDLKVRSGERVVVIGPSGSGKSTLIRCINRLEQPSGGRILFEGSEARSKQELRRMRSQMGMVFQGFNLFTHMTVLGNIIEAPTTVLGVPRDEAVAAARTLLDRVGLSAKAEVYPTQLSGGQKQRVAIARCLAMNPKLLLLDEITSALDPELVGEVLSVIRDLARQNMTMIIITHEMTFARDVADRVVFMDHGRIIEEDTPEAIFSAPKHERLQRFLKAVLERVPL